MFVVAGFHFLFVSFAKMSVSYSLNLWEHVVDYMSIETRRQTQLTHSTNRSENCKGLHQLRPEDRCSHQLNILAQCAALHNNFSLKMQ